MASFNSYDNLTTEPEHGDVNSIQALIHELQEELRPPAAESLIDAIRRGDMDRVRESAHELKERSTLEPKILAISLEKPDVLRLLLERDALIDEDMIVTASQSKNFDIIRMLLDFGWPIDSPIGLTASVLCTAVHDVDLMRWFVENGADVNARSKNDETALSIAIADGSLAVVEFLLEKTDITHGDLLHCAAQRKIQFEGAHLVDELVSKGANVNAHRFNNPVAFRWKGMFKQPTPLHVACRLRNIPVARALLQHGADPCLKMLEAGRLTEPTSLDMALEMKDQDLIDLLRPGVLIIRNLL